MRSKIDNPLVTPESSYQNNVRREVGNQIHNRNPILSKKEAASANRIVARLKESALHDPQFGEGYETLRAHSNVLDPMPWGTEKFVSPKDMTKETRFTPEAIQAVDTIITNCNDTLAAVEKFVESTTNTDDLPSVRGHLENVATSAVGLKTTAQVTKKQMLLLNATLD